ncbi:hypothetical protein TSAR_017019, partial [Trichomalopsis sarcophagae]
MCESSYSARLRQHSAEDIDDDEEEEQDRQRERAASRRTRTSNPGLPQSFRLGHLLWRRRWRVHGTPAAGLW